MWPENIKYFLLLTVLISVHISCENRMNIKEANFLFDTQKLNEKEDLFDTVSRV